MESLQHATQISRLLFFLLHHNGHHYHRDHCIYGDVLYIIYGVSSFVRNNAGGQTPQPIFTQNGSLDVYLRTDVQFSLKSAHFSNS